MSEWRQLTANANSNFSLEVSKGNISGVSGINKFGHAPDFDTGDGLITVWDGANDAGLNEMQYNYSATAAIDSITSSDNSDTQDIEILGLDSSWDLATQTVTLTGQTRAALSTSLIRVFRMINRGATDLAGNVYCFENVAVTSGVPDDSTKVRALIQGSNNQTLMAIYTVPNGKTGYMTRFEGFTAGGNKSSDFEINLVARPTGEVFQIKHHSTINDDAQIQILKEFDGTYPKFTAKTDIEMRVDILTVGITAASFSASFDLYLVDD